jgi:hypothetical protein
MPIISPIVGALDRSSELRQRHLAVAIEETLYLAFAEVRDQASLAEAWRVLVPSSPTVTNQQALVVQAAQDRHHGGVRQPIVRRPLAVHHLEDHRHGGR